MHKSVENEFLDWIRTRYSTALKQHGGMGHPTLARMLVQPDPDTVSYCFQMTAPDIAAAESWHDGNEASELRAGLTRQFGDRLVHFTTYMDILPLQ